MRFRFHGTIQKPRLLPQIHRLGFIERRHFCHRHTRMRQLIDRRAQVLGAVSDIRSQRQVHPFFNHALSSVEVYFIVSAPALAHCASCALVAPLTPIAPTIFPSVTRGIPPSTGTTPCSRSILTESPPAASAS